MAYRMIIGTNRPEAVFLGQLGLTMHAACFCQNPNKAACLNNGCLWTHWFHHAFFLGRVRILDSLPKIKLHSPFSTEPTATSIKNCVPGCDHATPAEPNQDPVNLEIKAVSFKSYATIVFKNMIKDWGDSSVDKTICCVSRRATNPQLHWKCMCL